MPLAFHGNLEKQTEALQGADCVAIYPGTIAHYMIMIMSAHKFSNYHGIFSGL